jgi:hypothetical protein
MTSTLDDVSKRCHTPRGTTTNSRAEKAVSHFFAVDQQDDRGRPIEDEHNFIADRVPFPLCRARVVGDEDRTVAVVGQ